MVGQGSLITNNNIRKKYFKQLFKILAFMLHSVYCFHKDGYFCRAVFILFAGKSRK